VPDLASPNLNTLDAWSFDPRRVEKPWGWELIWAHSETYVGKILFVRAGESLSLQYHNEKDESWYIEAGRAQVELGQTGDAVLNEAIISRGDAFRFRPGTVHRVTAIDDTTILEVSTPQLEDVVRLQDLYGREGTSTP
jgi:mannose-6-phosphate isomerase